MKMIRYNLCRRFGLKLTDLNPNEIYLILSFFSFFVFFLIISGTVIHDFVRQYLGIDILRTDSFGQTAGPAIQFLFVFFVVLNLALMLIFLRKKGIALRLIIFPVLIFLYVLSLNDLGQRIMQSQINKELRYEMAMEIKKNKYSIPDVSNLRIENFPSIEYETIFSKRSMLGKNIKSFRDLYEFSKKRYIAYAQYIERRWSMHDEQKMKAVFYMNLVSAMWGFGNVINENKSGCVLENEKNYWAKIPPENITARTYIESDIGCCTDYAYILKYLLDNEGIENRLVSIPGHIFNEAKFGGTWHVLDATANIMFYSSWEQIQSSDRNQKVRVAIFPHSNLVSNANPFYREAAGRFRISMLFQALYKSAVPIAYPELPPYIK